MSSRNRDRRDGGSVGRSVNRDERGKTKNASGRAPNAAERIQQAWPVLVRAASHAPQLEMRVDTPHPHNDIRDHNESDSSTDAHRSVNTDVATPRIAPTDPRSQHRRADEIAVLSRETIHALEHYLALLGKWNRHINLSGSRDSGTLLGHIIDCLAVIPHLPDGPRRVLDVGSGAGLPGAIVAIVRPNLAVTAIEPVHKKHAFLATVKRELQLANFTPLPERLEDHVPNTEPYDIAMSRATFALPTWLGHGRAAIHHQGIIVGMEGSEQHPLPPDAKRFPYQLDHPGTTARTRAIIVARSLQRVPRETSTLIA